MVILMITEELKYLRCVSFGSSVGDHKFDMVFCAHKELLGMR